MDFITTLVVGLVAGIIASLLTGGVGFGIVGDTIIGILGSYIGGELFQRMAWSNPLDGVPGAILIACVGACVLLFCLRFLVSVVH
jgi:uncharacterized membrane protein YeaQ/YmgE (transglycosylase-associated protein family)